MKKYRIWAAILAIVMVFGMFAGCSSKEEKPSDAPTAAPTASTGNDSTPAPSGDADGNEEVTWENKIILGYTTDPTGDISLQWNSSAADGLAYNLSTGYTTVELTVNDAQYVINQTAIKDFDVSENADGSKTATFELYDYLKWSNGEPLTAKDYIRKLLLFSCPLIVDMGAFGEYGYYEVGYHPFTNGEVAEFSGVRLLGENKFSVTIDAEHLPNFFEMRYYIVSPIYKDWLPANIDIADDGNGAYFTKDGAKIIMDASLQDEVGPAIDNFRWNPTAFCGPYCVTNYDVSAEIYTNELNPEFLGNYEGQKPSIETILIKKVIGETVMDELRTGSINFFMQSTEGAVTTSGLSMYDEGIVNFASYDRNGYGHLCFKCSCGPAQFKEVRHAVAYLLDRNDFARAFTGGFGSVVHGPYGSGMWMAQQGAAEMDNRLNQYSYNVDNAKAELEAGGWTLNADGTAYAGTGIRYKEVTAEQAGTGSNEYPGTVHLSDGRILMPLIIQWASSENNAVSDLLVTKLAMGAGTAEAGMEIIQTVMTFNEMYTEHQSNRDEHYFCAFNLATNFNAYYDQRLSVQPGATANTLNIDDQKLYDLAVDMQLVDQGDNETFLELWIDFIEEWNDYLPAIPLYSNEYYDFYTPHLINYTVGTGYVGFTGSVLYAWIEGYEPAN